MLEIFRFPYCPHEYDECVDDSVLYLVERNGKSVRACTVRYDMKDLLNMCFKPESHCIDP